MRWQCMHDQSGKMNRILSPTPVICLEKYSLVENKTRMIQGISVIFCLAHLNVLRLNNLQHDFRIIHLYINLTSMDTPLTIGDNRIINCELLLRDYYKYVMRMIM